MSGISRCESKFYDFYNNIHYLKIKHDIYIITLAFFLQFSLPSFPFALIAHFFVPSWWPFLTNVGEHKNIHVVKEQVGIDVGGETMARFLKGWLTLIQD